MAFVALRMAACWLADTNAKLTSKSAAAIVAATVAGSAHVAGLIRYVSLGTPSPADITVAERDAILPSCPLGLVQHVNEPGWVATAENGAQHGAAAAAHAKLIEYPAGCHIGVDMEGIHDVGAQVLAYLKAWIDAVHAAGFLVVVYWGYAFQVDPTSVLAMLGPNDVFWTDYGKHVAPPGAGWTLKQHAQSMVGGTLVDLDEDVGIDGRGNALVLMALAANDTVGPEDDPAASATDPARGAAIPIPSSAVRDTQPPPRGAA